MNQQDILQGKIVMFENHQTKISQENPLYCIIISPVQEQI